MRGPQADQQVPRDQVVLDNKFQVLVELGARDDAVLYAGLHLSTGRSVELHLLPRGVPAQSPAGERMVRAARAAGRVPHPNILSVVDSGSDPEGRPFVVYEQFGGVTAADWVERHGPLRPRQVGEIMMQVLAALEALHARGVIHRHLRPESVLIEPGEATSFRVKLSGFGYASIAGRANEPPDLPRGFSRYLSPEARLGETNAKAMDIYAAGVLMRFLLSGDAEPAVGLDATSARIIARATAEAPEERFLTAAHFGSAVAILVPEGLESLPPPDPLAADLKFLQRRRARESGITETASGKGRLELYPVLMMIEAAYGKLGAEGWRTLCEDVPDAEQLLPAAGNSDAWLAQGVPMDLVARLLAAADRIAGRGDLSFLLEVGAAVEKRGVSRFCPELPAQLTPEVLVDCVPVLWRSLARHGEVVVLDRTVHGARIAIRDQLEPSLELCAVMAGLLRAQLRSLSRAAEVSTLACQALGDAADIFVLSWS